MRSKRTLLNECSHFKHKRAKIDQNRVLLLTILNPSRPITIALLLRVIRPLAQVQRIVIFRKNGVQAMVELMDESSADRVKEWLHGCDIYSDCCTLKIEYARPRRLNVYCNGPDAFDADLDGYNDEEDRLTRPDRPVLINEDNNHAIAAAIAALLAKNDEIQTAPQLAPVSVPISVPVPAPATCPSPVGSAGSADSASISLESSLLPTNNVISAPPLVTPFISDSLWLSLLNNLEKPKLTVSSPVLMVYGLGSQFSCQRVFNLFCVYGNVFRVKFLRSKSNCAMVEMSDCDSVQRLKTNLDNVTVFNNKLQLSSSRQSYLSESKIGFRLKDGSPSFANFEKSKNHRFKNICINTNSINNFNNCNNNGVIGGTRNRIVAPTRLLHFFNAPPRLTEDCLRSALIMDGSPSPLQITFFVSKTSRSSSGLILFRNVEDATEALVLSNHHALANPEGKNNFPFLLKLAFSPKTDGVAAISNAPAKNIN